MRSAERLEGLAVSGPASLGGRLVRTPLLLDSGPAATGSPRILPLPGAPPGRRRLRLAFDDGALDLETPIPTPEITGAGSAEEIGPGAWTLHYPIPEKDWSRLIAAQPELLVLSNARSLLGLGDPLVAAIGELRRKLGAAPLLWAPRVGLPHRLALLTYLGVDFLDTTEGRWRSAEGEELDTTLGTWPTRAPVDSGTKALGQLLEEYVTETVRIQRALREGRLRELVELRIGSEPVLAELLRYADRNLADLLEERTPVATSFSGRYVYRESQGRPEAVRFRQRFLERYRPPPSKRVLLLVPCSRTKPYRNSRSHRRFARAFEALPWAHRIHVVSVTSPLGVVPRDLEDLPPARHYDIPVTGEWDEGERRSVTDAIAHLLTHGSYSARIAHLDPEEYHFLEEDPRLAGRFEWTLSDGRTTTAPAIAALQAALERLGPPTGDPLGPLASVRQELEALARMQFGIEAASRLFTPPVRLRGRPWFQRLCDDSGADLASWQERRGLFQLTVAGGRRLGPARHLQVEFDPALPLTGDLFTPGVRRADPAIRTGDAVLLMRGGSLAAVGEAVLPGRLMEQLSRGLAVEVRHRVHAGTTPASPPLVDTEMSGESSGAPGPVV
jgi:archaeosine synthase alpha-subunit